MTKHLLLLLLTSGVAYADQNNPTKDELLQTVHHIQALSKDLQVNLDKEKSEHASVSTALSEATKENILLQGEINSLTDKANKAIEDHDKILKKLHLAKWIFSGLATGIIILVCLQMGLLPPLLFYVAGGLIVGINAFIWIWL